VTDQIAPPEQRLEQRPEQRLEQRPEQRRGGFLARHLLALIILALAVVFVIENRQRVRIRAVLPWVTVPLWEAFVAMAVAGVLILALAQRRRSHQHR
jgi:uncharacterized integral membrane protein